MTSSIILEEADSLDYLANYDGHDIDFVFMDVPYPGMTIHDGSDEILTDEGWFREFGDLFSTLENYVLGDSDDATVAVLLNSKKSYSFVFELERHVTRTTGLSLIDMMVWLKPSVIPSKLSKNSTRFRQMFDFVLVFSYNPKRKLLLEQNTDGDQRRELNGLSSIHVNAVRANSGYDDSYKEACDALERDHKGRCPQQLVEYLIQAYTSPDDWVMDPFLGSGTTAAACKKLSRNCVGIDINPENIELATEYVRRVK